MRDDQAIQKLAEICGNTAQTMVNSRNCSRDQESAPNGSWQVHDSERLTLHRAQTMALRPTLNSLKSEFASNWLLHTESALRPSARLFAWLMAVLIRWLNYLASHCRTPSRVGWQSSERNFLLPVSTVGRVHLGHFSPTDQLVGYPGNQIRSVGWYSFAP